MYYLDLVSKSLDKLYQVLTVNSFEKERKKSNIYLWHRCLGCFFGYLKRLFLNLFVKFIVLVSCAKFVYLKRVTMCHFY